MDYLDWLRWWNERGAAGLEQILLSRWDPLGVGDDLDQQHAYARWATRIGARLRQGISAEEILQLLASAYRELGARVDQRRLAAVATEIRNWYRRERDDRPRDHWPLTYTRPES